MSPSGFVVALILRFYSICIVLMDLVHFMFYASYEILLAFVHLFKPPSKKTVRGEIAVVVGASRGVGRELAFELGSLGAEVICIDINSSGNEATVKELRLAGTKAHAYTCDVTSKDQVLKIVNTIEEDVGGISMLFHCCGVPSPRSYVSQPPPIKSTLDVSVVSHFWLLDAIVPEMKKRRCGHIVLLTSVAGVTGFKHQIPLGVSQFAVQGIFESLIENIRLEKFHQDIFVSLVHVYPFIVSEDLANDMAMRIPNCFGTIDARLAAQRILDGVLRNEIEISIPKHVLYIGHILRLLPRKATFMLREFLDTGVDFG